MEKTIIENGGRVIDDIAQAFFVVEEDGWDKEIWKQDKSRCLLGLFQKVLKKMES